MEPPAFQEAQLCDVCKCSFNTFRRRHHCRRCGRTLCHDHSSDQMALPQFGIYSPVRVCADCYNGSSSREDIVTEKSTGRLKKQSFHKEDIFRISHPGKSKVPTSSSEANSVADGVSSLRIGDDDDLQMKTETQPVLSVVECKCGMPLCICEAPAPSTDLLPMPKKPASTTSSPSNPRPKRTESSRNRGSTSNSKPSSVFNHGQVHSSTSDTSQTNYEVNGEGVREAIKNGDTAAVKKLLSQGVDANYHDKQGSSLLHLAAVFNQTEIAFALMDCGANLNYKNAQGETPLDCAPVMLQYKMREKIKEDNLLG